MNYFEPVKYIADFGTEMFWLVTGIVIGVVAMAMIDFVIDRRKK